MHQGINLIEGLKIKPYIPMGHLFLGELYVATGQREKALEHLEKAQNEFQEMGMDYWLGKTREFLAVLQNYNCSAVLWLWGSELSENLIMVLVTQS